MRLEHLWDNLPGHRRSAILSTLVRIIACQASLDRKEVTHEDA
jgi:hypothetical protein